MRLANLKSLAAGLLLAALGSTAILAQDLSGKWATDGHKLHNGESNHIFFDLKQEGNQLSGRFVSLGWTMGFKGTITGTHFELFRTDVEESKPVIAGDVVDGEMRGTLWNRPIVAHRAQPGEEISFPAAIPPPALHKVPSNGLAKTPPMGWNSWNLFADKIDDATVRGMADAMVTSGLRDAGYIYLNIDDTWEGLRDAQGNLGTNSKFPDMKALADYVHSKGLKIGLYSGPGPRTCGSYPASFGHEEQDARQWAAWGFDYLKYDWCSAGSIYPDSDIQAIYQKMGDALHATGRPIVFSLCEYGRQDVEKWGPEVGGNLWRTTDDIRDEWDSMISNIHLQVKTAPWAGPGRWNDPDMLEIGNGHMTGDEYRTHMSLWALTAAPLLAGNDIRSMTDETKSILLNKEVIAIDQDPLGKQASPVKDGNLETWIKPLADGSVAVGVVNLGATPAQATVKEADLHLKAKSARDLWAHKDVKFAQGAYSASVPAHATLLLRVSGK